MYPSHKRLYILNLKFKEREKHPDSEKQFVYLIKCMWQSNPQYKAQQEAPQRSDR